MKKLNLFAVLLAFLMLTVLFASCGASPSSAPAAESMASAPAASSEAAAAAAPEDAAAGVWDEAPAPLGGEEYIPGGESYLEISDNDVMRVQADPMLTFSLKVDTAAYSNVQRYIESGIAPPHDAVRIEEMINYFSYDEDPDFTEGPFAVYAEIGPSPLDDTKQMAFVRVKTEDVPKEDLPSSNLVFLIDTSGSMDAYDKLPLLKESFALLVDTLDGDDRVSIVTYAGSSEIVLDSASGDDKDKILRAIDRLTAGGSTAGADGIRTAYKLAQKNLMQNGNNRVILASDGDFNVGISSLDELETFIGNKRDSGVYLSILGFGTGNTRDDIMETLAKNGNGNYSYINTVETAEKVLVEELGSNLFTVAEDVKAQIEFNPANVASYRLVGYENRMLANEDFNDDTKDAGEIGVGTDVVMMFEFELASSSSDSGLKYGDAPAENTSGAYADELFEVRIRYKNPGDSESQLVLMPVTWEEMPRRNTSDYNFACAVAAFGHILRGSEYTGDATLDSVYEQAEAGLGRDRSGYRAGFLDLLDEYDWLDY